MKKVLISLLLTFLFIVSTFITLYAATGEVTLAASAESVVKGNTFKVIITGISDTKVIGLKAKLSYDEGKVELVKREAGENFTDASANNSEIAIATGGVGKESATLATYTFKIKDTAEVGDTTITVSDIVLAADTNIEISEDRTVTIKIKEDDTTVDAGGEDEQQPTDTKDPTDDEKPEDTKKPTTPSNDKSSSGSDKSTSGSKSNKKTTKLPQTGVETASLIAIVALSIVSIVSYVSYRRYKNI